MRVMRVVSRDQQSSDVKYWLSRPESERIAAVNFLNQQMYLLAGYKTLPRLEKVINRRPLGAKPVERFHQNTD